LFILSSNESKEEAMKNLLLGVGLITLLVGIWFAYQYLYTTGEKTSIYISAGAFVVSLGCLGYFFFLRFREEGESDISITKF
jgi:hypothetical protein